MLDYVSLVVVLIILLVAFTIFIVKRPKLKTPAQIVLAIAIVLLAYFVYESIMKPVRFNKEVAARRIVVIEKLEHIREAQIAFKEVHGLYANTFDTLAIFIESGKLPLVKKTSTLPDSLSELPEFKQIELGYLKFDTTFVSAFDSLYGDVEDFDLEKLSFIPFSEGDEFSLETGEIEKGQVKVAVMRVFAPKQSFLKGLDEDFIERDNVKDLEMGSMMEPSTDGNWE